MRALPLAVAVITRFACAVEIGIDERLRPQSDYRASPSTTPDRSCPFLRLNDTGEGPFSWGLPGGEVHLENEPATQMLAVLTVLRSHH